MSTVRLSGVANDSIVDGQGLRYTVFVQGCPHHCAGCHNPETHDFSAGYEEDTDKILNDILANPLLDGITLSGGEPMCQAASLLPLAKACRAHGLSVWLYSGYTFEAIIENPDMLALLKEVDVLIDGPFELEKRSLELTFKGSSNQRGIDVPESLQAGKPIVIF